MGRERVGQPWWGDRCLRWNDVNRCLAFISFLFVSIFCCHFVVQHIFRMDFVHLLSRHQSVTRWSAVSFSLAWVQPFRPISRLQKCSFDLCTRACIYSRASCAIYGQCHMHTLEYIEMREFLLLCALLFRCVLPSLVIWRFHFGSFLHTYILHFIHARFG